MNCATSTLKILVFVFNVLCAIIGLTTVIFCGLAIGTLDSEFLTYGIFGVAVGSIALIVSFFGCCGAYRENSGYMWIYAGILSMLVIIQLAIVISFGYLDIVHIATGAVEKLWDDEINNITKPMEDLEIQFECCGLYGPNDYPAANLTIPASCYSQNQNSTNSNLFEVGCLDKTISIYAYASKVIRATNWTLFGIEITALIFAFILARSFSRHAHMRYVTN